MQVSPQSSPDPGLTHVSVSCLSVCQYVCLCVFQSVCRYVWWWRQWLRCSTYSSRWYLSVCMYVCLSVCLSVCLYVCLRVCFSLYVGMCGDGANDCGALRTAHAGICLSVCLCVCLSVYLSVCMSVCMSVCVSVCMSVCVVMVLMIAVLYVQLTLVSLCPRLKLPSCRRSRQKHRTSPVYLKSFGCYIIIIIICYYFVIYLTQRLSLEFSSVSSTNWLKVKGRHLILPLTWTWPAAVYNAKWHTDRQWH